MAIIEDKLLSLPPLSQKNFCYRAMISRIAITSQITTNSTIAPMIWFREKRMGKPTQLSTVKRRISPTTHKAISTMASTFAVMARLLLSCATS